MLRLRVQIPDRPGSLAAVAQAVATTGADIVHLAVMHRADGTAVDDFWLPRVAEPLVDLLLARLSQLPGVRVLGHRVGAVPVEFDAQLDFLAYLFAAPQRGVEALVEMLPAVTDADWAVIRDDATQCDEHESHVGPLPNAQDDEVLQLATAGGLTVLLGRDKNLPWHPAEFRRVVSVLELASMLIVSDAAARTGGGSVLTRRFVTAYTAAI